MTSHRATVPQLLETWRRFAGLPVRERLHVLARDFSAPMREVARRVPQQGEVLDVGSGHGLMESLLAAPGRSLTGIDPDPLKVQWASRALGGTPSLHLEVARIEDLAERRPGAFAAVVVCDVLYLLPPERWLHFLQSAQRLLGPGGVLLLKEAEADGSWRHLKCLAQEWVMVHALRRTHGSGGLHLKSRDDMRALLGAAGFEVDDVVDLSERFTTPHVLYVARPQRAG